MADEKTRRTRTVAKAFKPKEAFGEPKALLMTDAFPKDTKGLPIDGHTVIMGTFIGRASKVGKSQRENAAQGTMDYFFCLEGNFKALPVKEGMPEQASSKAWLPEYLHNDIASALKINDPLTGTVNQDGAETVEFAFEVGIRSSQKVAAGFEWVWQPLVEREVVESTDPLAGLMKRVAAIKSQEGAKFIESKPEPEIPHAKGKAHVKA